MAKVMISTSAVVLICFGIAHAGNAPVIFNTLSLSANTTGGSPIGSLVQGVDGNLYGTTSYTDGAAGMGGTVFKVNQEGLVNVLYHFCGQANCSDGETPRGGLVQANSSFYGTTSAGGAHNGGTIFQITASGTLNSLYNFCSQPRCMDGAMPDGALVQAIDGNFYGVTSQGGTNNFGTIFKITAAGQLTVLYDFCTQPNCADGSAPEGSLVQAADGMLYGTTSQGGTNDAGTVFKISMRGAFTSLHSFNGTDGFQPVAGLVQAASGDLYGTTDSGGAYNNNCPSGCGTLFQITPEGVLTTIYEFCGQSDCADGLSPQAPLVQATDGNLYGTTFAGGNLSEFCSYGCGTLFQINAGKLTTLYSFCAQTNCRDGYIPLSPVLQETNGSFYGMTYEGGAFFSGTIFGLSIGLAPFVMFVRSFGYVGQTGPILGQGFTGTTNVSLNGSSIPFTVKSDTLITATIPAGGATGSVTVTTPTGTLTSNVPFRVLPQLLSFTPTSGPVGTQVTITGVSFTQTSGVGFGDYTPAQFTVNSDTQVTATVPAGAQTGPVGIQTQGGIAISTQTFTVTQ